MSAPQVTENLTKAMRREPVQERSQLRVELLLDTTAAMVDEVGIEGVTTGLLAERAEVSIGSVYRFFPDRISLMRSLSRRNLERFAVRYMAELDRTGVNDWHQALDVTVSQFVEMHETEPGFRSLRFGDVIDEQLLDGTESNNGVLAESFRELLVDRFGVRPTRDLGRQVQVVTDICDGLLARAFLIDSGGDEWMVNECKVVAREYLEQRLELV